jgi:hypothetical protein
MEIKAKVVQLLEDCNDSLIIIETLYDILESEEKLRYFEYENLSIVCLEVAIFKSCIIVFGNKLLFIRRSTCGDNFHISAVYGSISDRDQFMKKFLDHELVKSLITNIALICNGNNLLTEINGVNNQWLMSTTNVKSARK